MALDATAKMLSSPHSLDICPFDCCSIVLIKFAGLTVKSSSPVVDDSPMRSASD